MKYNIRGDKLVVTKSIKDYVEEKLDRLNKYYENHKDLECKVIVRSKNNLQSIEVTIPANKFILRAEVAEKDLYAAIDLVVDKLEGQIRKNKTRLKNRYEKTEVQEMFLNFEVEYEEEKLDIVKRKDIETKPMDEEEALLQMELLNHDFFVFKNIDEECVSVIYKRKDNKYGIINVK
ncbi:MAG: ribosome-associated translation inhibitor RaiA [Firmicutes bacterium]|nr:ribosome-associated translation inhibitor RaiA [Bacillota bacterium]